VLKPLTATYPLDGRSTTLGDTALWVIRDRPIYSLSVPLGEDARFEAALQGSFGLSRPAPGASTVSANGDCRLCGLAQDQFFLIAQRAEQPDASALAALLGTAAYVTDQSDSWVSLHLKGALALPALERICPINLAPSAFPAGALARTSMEHLGAIILADDEGGFTLISAISSAESFWHAVEQSLRNVM